MERDIRWEQRYNNYLKALGKLKQGIEYAGALKPGETVAFVLDEIIKEGIIQRFEYTHELAWNTMKDFIEYEGNADIKGSRDTTREAFKLKLIADGDIWMDMIKSRNSTSHTYNEATADEIFRKIIADYYPAFLAFAQTMEKLRPQKG